MVQHGLTKARSMGAVAQVVEAAGGSVSRVFGRAEVPLALMDDPDRLILLSDQLRLVECAVREIGDAALPARLSTQTGVAGLGAIGRHVRSSPTLGAAIQRMGVVTPQLLQTATWTGLVTDGPVATYGYAVQERIETGRQVNEVLALGYLLGVARHFLGDDWRPSHAVVTGAVLRGRAEIEGIFDCDLSLGARAGIVFPSDLLATSNPDPCGLVEEPDDLPLPDLGDLVSCVEQIILLGLIEERPGIDWVARKLGCSRRTLQRRLDERRTSFGEIQRRVLLARAKLLLSDPTRSIGQSAQALGYADPAHFSRAFLEWTGVSPRTWRKLAGGAVDAGTAGG